VNSICWFREIFCTIFGCKKLTRSLFVVIRPKCYLTKSRWKWQIFRRVPMS